jgi:hypothetical protein
MELKFLIIFSDDTVWNSAGALWYTAPLSRLIWHSSVFVLWRRIEMWSVFSIEPFLQSSSISFFLLASFSFVLGVYSWILKHFQSMRRKLQMTCCSRLSLVLSYFGLFLLGRCSVGRKRLTFPYTDMGSAVTWIGKQMIYKHNVTTAVVTSVYH